MGLFKSGSKTTTTSGGSQPWAPTIPGLQMSINASNQAFQSGVGSQPYTGSMVVPFSQYSTNAFTNMNNLASKFQPGLTQAGMNVNALANEGGLNKLQDLSASQLAPIAAQKVAEGTGQFNDVQKQAYGYLNPIAAGQMMQGNPYLDEVINRSTADITGAQNMAASAAGRYGSGGYQAATQKAIGDMAAPLRFADYNTQQGRMDQAIRDVFGMGTQANTQTEADWARKMGAIGAQAELGQQQWQNITALPGQMAAGYQAALAPSTTQLGIGSQYEDLNRRYLNDTERQFREAQAAPWQTSTTLMQRWAAVRRWRIMAPLTVRRPNRRRQCSRILLAARSAARRCSRTRRDGGAGGGRVWGGRRISMSGSKKNKSAGAPALPEALPGPTLTVPPPAQPMPGQLELLAQQLHQGYPSMPQADILKHMQTTYRPPAQQPAPAAPMAAPMATGQRSAASRGSSGYRGGMINSFGDFFAMLEDAKRRQGG